jgi:tRNA threonylcarbamoyl adenosine modification protein (Sua5/YciO/YrdC/YwlC family)
MTLATGCARVSGMQVTFVLNGQLDGSEASLEALAQSLGAIRRRQRQLAAQPQDLRNHEQHGRRRKPEYLEFYPKADREIARDIQIENRERGEPRNPQQIDDLPGARGQTDGLFESGFEHAAHQRLLAKKRAAQKDESSQRQQDGQLPLNETLIVQQQRRRAEHQHRQGADDVHGFEFAGARPVHHQQEHAAEHQRRSSPVDIQNLKGDKKNDQRRPFEELTHPRIIADDMSIYLQLHPVSPQRRYVRQAVEMLRGGGVIVYPTDSCYALGCHIGDKTALQRIRDIRQTDRNHHFTLVCRDLADVGKYALVENWQYRLLRAHTPGPYTFLLKASRETPRRLKHERRGTIGLRVPDHPVTAMLLSELGEPVMSSTLLLPGEDLPRTDAREIYEKLERSVDLVLDGGNCGLTPTSVIDLSGDRAIVIRAGRGDVSPFEATATV